MASQLRIDAIAHQWAYRAGGQNDFFFRGESISKVLQRSRLHHNPGGFLIGVEDDLLCQRIWVDLDGRI